MKKICFIQIVFSLILQSGYSQINFFNWNSNLINDKAPTARGDCITFGENSNIFYALPDGRICNAYYFNGSWSYNIIPSAAKAKFNSKFIYGDNRLFYVDLSGKIRELRYLNGVWVNYIINNNAPLARGDGLVFAPNSNIFYTTTKGEICNLFYDNGWKYNVVLSAISPKSDSRFTFGDNKLFYVDKNSELRVLYFEASSWHNPKLNPNAPRARGDGLVFGENSNIYYTTSSNQICNIYFFSSVWNFNVVTPNSKAFHTKTDLIYSEGKVYYRGEDKQMRVLFYDNCSWQFKRINQTKISNRFEYYIPQFTPQLAFGDNKLFYISSDSDVSILYPTIDDNYPFVYLKGKRFFLKNQEFKPFVMNYLVNINTDDHSNYWVSPHHSFSNDNSRCCSNQNQSDALFLTHFSKIKSLGFNTVRLTVGVHSSADKSIDDIFMGVKRGSNLDNEEVVLTPSFETKYFGMLEHLLDLAEQADLKVILLTGNQILYRDDIYSKYSTLLGKLGTFLKDKPSLLAYDVYNEPGLGNGIISYTKDYYCNVMNTWYQSIRAYDPNHLVTIGVFGSSDLETWDPSMLSVDFLSIHIYPYQRHFEYVGREFKWLSLNITKPWIIGETGFSAFDAPDICSINGADDGTYGWGTELKQFNYANFSIARTFMCGGSGYSWWTYKDVYHDPDSLARTSEDFEGVFTRCGRPKPVIGAFSQNWEAISCGSCPTPDAKYYYNYSESGYKVVGKLLDDNNKPIVDGLVLGWDSNWGNGTSTFSKSDGTFTLCSNVPIGIIRVAAKKKANSQFQINQNTVLYNLGTKTLVDLKCSSLDILD